MMMTQCIFRDPLTTVSAVFYDGWQVRMAGKQDWAGFGGLMQEFFPQFCTPGAHIFNKED